jgi:hypothetical protein
LRYKKGLNNKLIRIRREIYRKFVSDLAKKYSICGIEDFDLRRKLSRGQVTKWGKRFWSPSPPTMKAWPISPRVNSPKNNDPDLIGPL